MLLGTLVSSLLENLLSGKDVKENGQGVIQAGDEKKSYRRNKIKSSIRFV